MDVGAVIDRVRGVGSVDAAGADRAAVLAALGSLAAIGAWCDAAESALAARLTVVAPRPDFDLADAGRLSSSGAAQVLERVEAITAAPVFGSALAAATITAGHIDVFARGLRQLTGTDRGALTQRADALVDQAAVLTVPEFRRVVAGEIRRLQRDGGMAEYRRQRRDTGLRLREDLATGMWHLSGRFDPRTGLVLGNRLATMVDTLRARPVDPDCPTDPALRQDWLRAHALVTLTDGAGNGSVGGRPEVVVVVDATQLDTDGRPRIDLGMDLDLPHQILAEWVRPARVWPVVVTDARELVGATGSLDLGRSTRVANRAQRRVLQAFHPTCAIAGCTTRFANCSVHHIHWWRHGGATDLANLVPLCNRHHHAVHDHGWTIRLAPGRTLELSVPAEARPPPATTAA